MNAYFSVGIWIRVSTQMQVQDESPAHHELRARAYAQAQGWHVVTVYDLGGVSGKDVLNHPETKRMIDDVRAGRIKALLFSKLARLARNTQQLLYFADIFRAEGASLVSLSEAIDTSTPAGRFFFTLLSAMANWEREEIAQRIKDSIVSRAQLGKSLGGTAPFGYVRVEGRLELHPEEAPVRKLMIELYLKHRRLKKVVQILNEAGYRTRQGNPFSHSSVKILLRDPITKGLRRANYIQDYGDHWEYKPESEWIYTSAPALVDEATWDACLAILDEQALKQKRKGRNPIHLFAGLVVCGQCGKKMYIRHKDISYRCNPCERSIHHNILYSLFSNQVKAFLDQDQWIEAENTQAEYHLTHYQQEISTLSEQRLQIRHEQDALHRLFAGNYLSGFEFRERNLPLYEQSQIQFQRLDALDAEVSLIRSVLAQQTGIVQNARKLIAEWPDLDRHEQHANLESIVDSIEIGDQDITILLDLAYRGLSAQQLKEKRCCNSLDCI